MDWLVDWTLDKDTINGKVVRDIIGSNIMAN